VAHWFAFRVSARLVGAGNVRREDAESAGVQLLAAFIGLVGFAVARGAGAPRARALVYVGGSPG
jgi:hypothetical protein